MVKKILLVVVYNYYKCFKVIYGGYKYDDVVEIVKSNILLVGLIGLGKILFV